MGVFDFYCSKCGLPFYSLHDSPFQQKTQWLNNAVIVYKGHNIYLKDFDSYGNFTLAKSLPAELKNDKDLSSCINNGVLNLVELSEYGFCSDYKCCNHVSCLGRTDVDKATLSKMKKFHLQTFDVDGFVNEKSLHWLTEQATVKSPKKSAEKPKSPIKSETKAKSPVKSETKAKSPVKSETKAKSPVKSETKRKITIKRKPKVQQDQDKQRNPCTILNPDSGRFVNLDGPTGLKVMSKYAPKLIGK